jgi:hypothetical protein
VSTRSGHLLFGKPLEDASDDDVRRSLAHAKKCLMDMRYPDKQIEDGWLRMIGVMTGEMARRGLPLEY